MAKRWRGIREAAAEIREQDPNTVLTEWFLRQLVTNNMIHHKRTGRKYVISLEDIEAFLEGGGVMDGNS